MADIIHYKIFGDDMQVVEIELDPREGVRAEAGAMMYMEDGIEMQTSTGGIFQGVKRIRSIFEAPNQGRTLTSGKRGSEKAFQRLPPRRTDQPVCFIRSFLKKVGY